MECGVLIGNIRLIQQFLQRPVSPKEELIKKSDTELAKILDSRMAEWNNDEISG